MNNNITKKLQEYKSLMDYNNEYFKRDFKNNVKFMEYAISKFIKKKLSENDIVEFINTAINIHKRIYM